MISGGQILKICPPGILLMKKITQILIILGVYFFPSLCSAQVMIEQGKVELTAVPGQTLTGSIDVHNNGDKPLKIRAYLGDFVYVEPFNGKKEFRPAGVTDYSMADWFSFLPRELTLQPYEKRKINYSIKVPADADGGYYNVLFVERNAGRVGAGAMAGVQIISRVGALFFVETSNARPRGKIDDIKADGGNLRVHLTNTGKMIIIPQSTYFIIDQGDRAVKRGEAGLLYLPPGKTAQFSLPAAEGLDDGNYTLVLTIDLGKGEALVREVDFRKTKSAVEILKIRE